MDKFFLRKVPDEETVPVMASKNSHMSEDLIREPGLIILFASGHKYNI